MLFVLACLVALALLAGCGEDDDEQPAAAELADLVVVVDPDGDRGGKPVRRARVQCDEPADSAACRAASRLSQGDFAPVPDNAACTLQYGGPDTARVTGTLRGERVDARFQLDNGCEIHRWHGVADLLGAAS
jgi:hypothetical protein